MLPSLPVTRRSSVCPGCGSDTPPAAVVRCAEEIVFYSCRHCDFSTWEPSDFEKGQPVIENLYADEMKPLIEPRATYTVRVPNHDWTHWAQIHAEEDDLVELEDWRWGDVRDVHRPLRPHDPGDQKIIAARNEVWEWLAEWEIVRLRPIGPEDSEYFAGEALTSTPA